MPANAAQPGDAPIDLNILPPEYRPREWPASLVLLVVAALLAFALPLGVLGATRVAEERSAALAAGIVDAEATLVALPPPDPEAVRLSDEIRHAQEASQRLDDLRVTTEAGRWDWTQALAAIGNYDPERVAPQRLTQAGNALTLEGWAASPGDLDAYAAGLEGSGAIDQTEVLAQAPLSPDTPGGASAGDPYEPDDDAPRPIGIGEVQSRVFDPRDDVDQVTFVGKAGRRYCVQALPLAPGVDTVLEVHVAGTVLTNDDCQSEGVRTACACPEDGALGSLASLVEVQPPADGDYTVLVRVTNRGEYGPGQRYSLLVSEVLGDPWEHDDDRPSAIAPGESQPRTFFPVGDVDRALLRVKAHRAYRVWTADLSPEVDTHLTVSVDGDVYESDDVAPGDRSSSVAFVARANGEALITVANRGQYGATAVYSLRAEETPLDAYEPDDYAPATIALWEEQARTFYPAGDIDRAEFSVKAGRTYEVKTYNLAIGVDTVLAVLVGGVLYENDDLAAGERASRVVFTAVADGVAGVTVTNAGQFGPDKGYWLTVLERAVPPTVTPTRTTIPSPSATPTTTPVCADAHEPDDIVPRLASVGEARLHSLCPVGDEDRVVFTAKPGYAYRIETLHLAAGVDTVLNVQIGAQHLTNDDRAPQDLSSMLVVHNTSTAETPVFVSVTNKGTYGPDRTYTLLISDAGAGDAYEPDDVTPAPIVPGASQVRTFYPPGDVDRAAFTAKPGRRYAVYTLCGERPIDTVLSVHVGTVQASNDDHHPGTVCSYVEIQHNGPHDATAHVTVYNNGPHDPLATYTLHVDDLGAPAADAYEPDVDAAPVLGIGEAQRRTFFPEGDIDRALLQVKAGRRYAVYTCGPVGVPAGTPTPRPGGEAGCPALAPGVDTILLVHGPVRACVPEGCQSDDTDPGTGRLNSRVEFDAIAGGEAVITVYNKGSFGPDREYWLLAEEIGAVSQGLEAPAGRRIAGLAAPIDLPTLAPPITEAGIWFRMRLVLPGAQP